jgi:hypothetical protein
MDQEHYAMLVASCGLIRYVWMLICVVAVLNSSDHTNSGIAF